MGRIAAVLRINNGRGCKIMGYLLAGAFIGSLTTFSAMVLVICADTKKEEKRFEELEEKHWSECRQISEYEAENKRLKEQLNNLIDKYEAKK